MKPIKSISDLEKMKKSDLVSLIGHLGHSYSVLVNLCPELISEAKACSWSFSEMSLNDWLASDRSKRASELFDEISVFGINEVISVYE